MVAIGAKPTVLEGWRHQRTPTVKNTLRPTWTKDHAFELIVPANAEDCVLHLQVCRGVLLE
jgi:hypothetical protein